MVQLGDVLNELVLKVHHEFRIEQLFAVGTLIRISPQAILDEVLNILRQSFECIIFENMRFAGVLIFNFPYFGVIDEVFDLVHKGFGV